MQVLIDPRDGHLITDGTWKYKIPAVSCIPETLNVYFLEVGALSASSYPLSLCLGFVKEDKPTVFKSSGLEQDSPNPRAVVGSKAVGEPSLLLSTTVLYAIRHAVCHAHYSGKSVH